MKFKFLLAFMIGGFALASAQGFKDAAEYYRADQPEEAEIIINRVINDPSTDKSMAYFYLGQIAYQRGDIAAAKAEYDKGLQANPQNPYNLVGLGKLALKAGNKSAAEDYFKQAKALVKKDAVLTAEVARAYYEVDPVKYEKEIAKNIADARKFDKNCPATFILQADMLAPTSVGDAAGFYEMAMNAPESAKYPEAFVKYARTYFPVNARFALDGLRKLLEITPNSALAQRELAEKYYDNNQLTLAAEQYGKYIQNPNHFQRDEQRYAGLLYFGGKYDESNAIADGILRQDPDNVYMKRIKLYNYAALEQYDNALKAADALFASKGDFEVMDYTTYADVLQKTGQDALAVAQYEKAIALAPEKAELLKDLSAVYAQSEQYGKAAEAQQKFIDKGDYSTNDLMVLARRYQNAAASSEIGTPERADYSKRAIETINAVYEKVPDNYQVLLTRARIMLIANDNQVNDDVVAAMKDVLAMLDADPENITKRANDYIFIYNQLGKYYLDQKDLDTAKIYYNKFLEVDPTNEPLRNFVETVLNK